MTVLTRPRSASITLLTSSLSSAVSRRPTPIVRSRVRTLTASSVLQNGYRRSQDFTSGFSSSYDPNQDGGRGPMFNKSTFGVPNFYPRDLKKRVDDYVVGQDRAKKTICSVIFNHYQNLRRRQHHESQDQRLREKLLRQKFARERDLFERSEYHNVQPGDEEFLSGGQPEPARSTVGLGSSEPVDEFYIPEEMAAPQHVKIDKSNLLLIGPTGVGKTYILEYDQPPLLTLTPTDSSTDITVLQNPQQEAQRPLYHQRLQFFHPSRLHRPRRRDMHRAPARRSQLRHQSL